MGKSVGVKAMGQKEFAGLVWQGGVIGMGRWTHQIALAGRA